MHPKAVNVPKTVTMYTLSTLEIPKSACREVMGRVSGLGAHALQGVREWCMSQRREAHFCHFAFVFHVGHAFAHPGVARLLHRKLWWLLHYCDINPKWVINP